MNEAVSLLDSQQYAFPIFRDGEEHPVVTSDDSVMASLSSADLDALGNLSAIARTAVPQQFSIDTPRNDEPLIDLVNVVEVGVLGSQEMRTMEQEYEYNPLWDHVVADDTMIGSPDVSHSSSGRSRSLHNAASPPMTPRTKGRLRPKYSPGPLLERPFLRTKDEKKGCYTAQDDEESVVDRTLLVAASIGAWV